MKTILLTGASGFIGNYFRTKYKDRYRIVPFSFRKDDFQNLDLSQIDCVVHLSALVHQMNGAPEEAYKRINVEQTLALAQKAKTFGVKHFIFMSTIKVCGEESDTAYTEKSVCLPVDPYGKSKYHAEKALKELEDTHFKVAIIRTPIVYGYGVKANIKSLVKLVNTVPILPFKGITNKRSMVYIGNLCHLIEVIVDQEANGLFLAGDDKPLSTTELITLIAKFSNRNIHLVQIPFFDVLLKSLKPSFYRRLYGNLFIDNSETKKQLHFTNPYTVEQGIEYMIKGGDTA